MAGAMKILAGNSNRPLTEAIAAYLGLPLTKCQVRRFADMEIFVEILENVRGQDTFVIQSTSAPTNDHLMEALIMFDALRRASARRITAVIPYFGYARQDRKPGPRTPISAKLVANLITRAGADRVLTVDLHAGQIQGFFDIPTDNLYAAPVLVRDIQENLKLANVMVVSPDVGGVMRARALAKRINAPLAIVDKRRERPGEFGSDEHHRRGQGPQLHHDRRHCQFRRHLVQRRRRPDPGRGGGRARLYHPWRALGRRGGAHRRFPAEGTGDHRFHPADGGGAGRQEHPGCLRRAPDRRGHRPHRQGRKRLQPVRLTARPGRISRKHAAMTFETDLKTVIRSIPDYPKKGIMFRDITTLLGNARAFRRAVDELVQPFAGQKIDQVAGMEARGFILGGAVAHQLSAGFIPIRKKGKLPHQTVSIAYSLEYGVDEMEMHEDAVKRGEKVVLVDDLIATGGTAEGAVKLLRKMGAEIVAACFVIDLPELGGAQKVRDLGVPVRSLIAFEGH